MKNRIVPQQYAGQRPPKGWVPPLGQDLTLLGVYDNESGYWMGLPLQVLREALLTAESLHTEDRIDERDKIEVTVPDASAQDVVKTKEYEVPAGELWYINRLNLVTEAIGEKELPVAYLLGEKYISSLQELSSSDNSKFVVFPADIHSALRGMMGRK